MTSHEFKEKATILIDDLKAVCANAGLGNDGNEFKIITQVFLYKFLNDKFAYEVKKLDKTLTKGLEENLRTMNEDDYDLLILQLPAGTAKLKPDHLLSHIYKQQNEKNFAKLFDATLLDIAKTNSEIFSVQTNDGEKIVLFDEVTQFVASERDKFAKAIINKLSDSVSFEHIFSEKFDFYATLFEYLIKDYNKDGGGKYAEYYTPHAVAKIMAACLVTKKVKNVSCYDPSAGSGTLLMNLAHAIGVDRCTLFTEDISQKSSSLLRLNLILNNLVHSIPNVIQGNTILNPFHKDATALKKFDYIVSNPPFKLDFSDFRGDLDTKENKDRFFAGIPKVPPKAKEKMAIYSLFLQHIIKSLGPKGKAAVVVPTGFNSETSKIDYGIRKYLVENKLLGGVISMPSNIFATTGTSVSILFIDSSNKKEVVLIDASGLGTTIKEGRNQKTLLDEDEQNKIVAAFNDKTDIEGFSIPVTYNQIIAKNFSFNAGQYFDVKIEYSDLSHDEFLQKVEQKKDNISNLFKDSKKLEKAILKNIGDLEYDI